MPTTTEASVTAWLAPGEEKAARKRSYNLGQKRYVKWERTVANAMHALWEQQKGLLLVRLKGKQGRKGTRHWQPPGDKPVNARRLLDVDHWSVVCEATMSDVFTSLINSIELDVMSSLKLDETKQDDLGVRRRFVQIAEKHTSLSVQVVREKAEKVLDLIEERDRNGDSMDEIVEKIEALYDHERWAKNLAEHTVIGAVNEAAIVTVEERGSSGTQKEWVSQRDTKVRPSHALADGQKVDVDGYFKVGGNLLAYPHDLDAPIGETANCRCVVVFVRGRKRGRKSLNGAHVFPLLEEKAAVRRVRTQAGVRHFNLPIGSLIIAKPPTLSDRGTRRKRRRERSDVLETITTDEQGLPRVRGYSLPDNPSRKHEKFEALWRDGTYPMYDLEDEELDLMVRDKIRTHHGASATLEDTGVTEAVLMLEVSLAERGFYAQPTEIYAAVYRLKDMETGIWLDTVRDPKLRSELEAEIDDLSADYPSAFASLDSISHSPSYAFNSSNTYAHYSPFYRQIELNALHFDSHSSVQAKEAKTANDASARWHPHNTSDPRSVLSHEFAHHLHRMLRGEQEVELLQEVHKALKKQAGLKDRKPIQSRADFTRYWFSADKSDEMVYDFRIGKNIPAKLVVIRNEVSVYAMQSIEEMIAEAWAEGWWGAEDGSARPVAQAVADYMDYIYYEW